MRICIRCKRLERPTRGGRCLCGASSWVTPGMPDPPPLPAPPRRPPPPSPPAPPPPPAPTPGIVLMGDTVEGLVVDRYDGAELADVCGGGVMRGGVLLVGGLAGVGKSTLAAELGAIVAEELDGLVYWLDRDQRSPALIHETFARTGSSRSRLAIVQEREVDDPLYVPLTWRAALDMVPAAAACVVVDSLETWAERERERQELVRELRRKDAFVKVVIAPTNAVGGVAGERSLPRAGDATITIGDDVVVVDKCRWFPKGVYGRRERGMVER